jgi:rubrerythrin
LKSVFNALVKAEETHKAALLDTYRNIKGVAAGSEALSEGALSGLMESGVSVEEAVAWVKQRDRDPRDILEFSMQLETNSLDLYMKVRRESEDEGVRETFRSLIDEEKRHLARLGNLLNSMYNV